MSIESEIERIIAGKADLYGTLNQYIFDGCMDVDHPIDAATYDIMRYTYNDMLGFIYDTSLSISEEFEETNIYHGLHILRYIIFEDVLYTTQNIILNENMAFLQGYEWDLANYSYIIKRIHQLSLPNGSNPPQYYWYRLCFGDSIEYFQGQAPDPEIEPIEELEHIKNVSFPPSGTGMTNVYTEEIPLFDNQSVTVTVCGGETDPYVMDGKSLSICKDLEYAGYTREDGRGMIRLMYESGNLEMSPQVTIEFWNADGDDNPFANADFYIAIVRHTVF